MKISRSRLLPFVLCLSISASAAQAVEIRTVRVSPVPGDPAASGAALIAALAGIASPSSTNPWLLKIEPGIYDVGDTPLQMRSWVDIEGSGIGVTTIRNAGTSGAFLQGAVEGASNAELRNLTVRSAAIEGRSALAMANNGASPRLYRARFEATGGSDQRGIRNINSANPTMDQIEVAVTASGEFAYGIVHSTCFTLTCPYSMRRSRVEVIGNAIQQFGLYSIDSHYLAEARDSEILVSGGGTNIGVELDNAVGAGGVVLTLVNTEIDALGGTNNIAIKGGTALSQLRIEGSNLRAATGSGSNTAIQWFTNGPVRITNSELQGTTQTISSNGLVQVGASRLIGGPVTGSTIACAGSFNQAFTFFPGPACP